MRRTHFLSEAVVCATRFPLRTSLRVQILMNIFRLLFPTVSLKLQVPFAQTLTLTLPVRRGQRLQPRPCLCSCVPGSLHSRSSQCRKSPSSPFLGRQRQARRPGLSAGSGCLQDGKHTYRLHIHLNPDKTEDPVIGPDCFSKEVRLDVGPLASNIKTTPESLGDLFDQQNNNNINNNDNNNIIIIIITRYHREKLRYI